MYRGFLFCWFAILLSVSGADKTVTIGDCTYASRPDEFLQSQTRVRAGINRKLLLRGSAGRTADPASIPVRNFVDEEIFGKLQESGVRAAAVSTDEEFLRRVMLDLTGRIPSPNDVRSFVSDGDPGKRDALIDKLINSSEFVDKWTWWLSDLLQVNATASNFSRQINGRNAFYLWIKAKVSENASLKDIAYQCVTGSGNNFLMEEAASNFVVNSITPMGPIQDQYDSMLSKTASTFLGMAYYDCILCHNGRGHLDQLSLWGRSAARIDAERMAAFFSRQNIANHPEAGVRDSFFSGARIVTDRTAGSYALNTTNGNRPPRCAPNATITNNRCSATLNLDPEYQYTGAKPAAGRTWRESFADNMVADPMFARNLANRVWKEMFNLGLVDPVDTMDPARLDPGNPPPDGWALQATHPVLLEKLAAALREGNFSLRELLRLIAASSAYQLSSRYGDEWKVDYIPLFARHYPRRLEGEEVHDAIVKATGVIPTYTVQNLPYTVNWAMQLPDPSEPRSNGAAANFMNAFLRGNRDTMQRNQSGSILQQLNLMNDAFVLTRNKVGASAALRALANNSDNQKVVEELFLLFLGRAPSGQERADAVNLLGKAGSQAARNAAVEDIAWVLMNKVEFLFSY
ncbi:MAG: DUF1553 domain-containing protein [Bryobacterales bacterium]|nr:DUF1553 domain-containing protein [Bryobacterales bacterium]